VDDESSKDLTQKPDEHQRLGTLKVKIYHMNFGKVKRVLGSSRKNSATLDKVCEKALKGKAIDCTVWQVLRKLL